jgi:hypothetical protein
VTGHRRKGTRFIQQVRVFQQGNARFEAEMFEDLTGVFEKPARRHQVITHMIFAQFAQFQRRGVIERLT